MMRAIKCAIDRRHRLGQFLLTGSANLLLMQWLTADVLAVPWWLMV
jgi:hypothetical protein